MGQIRTNQFVNASWSLREFKLLRNCTGQCCTAMRLVPVTDKLNPFGPLFGDPAGHPRANEFQASEPNRLVQKLASTAFDSANINMPDRFNTGQSHASGSTENNYLAQFVSAPAAFRDRIQDRLTSVGSTLTPGERRRAACRRCPVPAAIGSTTTWTWAGGSSGRPRSGSPTSPSG